MSGFQAFVTTLVRSLQTESRPTASLSWAANAATVCSAPDGARFESPVHPEQFPVLRRAYFHHGPE